MAVNTDINKMLLNQVFSIYNQMEQDILVKIANNVDKGLKPSQWSTNKLKDTQQLKSEVQAMLTGNNTLIKDKVSKGIFDAFTKGVISANNDHNLPNTILKELIPPHIERMILETNNLIDGTSFQILRNTMDVNRQVIADSSMGVLTGGTTPREAASKALNAFAAKGITSFIDKAGRNWDMASYVDMAVRTTTARAALQGHIDRQTDIGNDLVIVSGFAATCPICMPWGGKVLSISGNSDEYSSLDMAKSAGLFHPNCKHTITAYFPFIDESGAGTLHEHDRGYNAEQYKATQRQRGNERQIRKYKRLEAAALTPKDVFKARNKIRAWQAVQRQLCKDFDLRRNYGREGLRIGDANKVITDSIIKPHTPAPVIPRIEPPSLITQGMQIKANSYDSVKKWYKDLDGGEKTLVKDMVKVKKAAGTADWAAHKEVFAEFKTGKTIPNPVVPIVDKTPALVQSMFDKAKDISESTGHSVKQAYRKALDAGDNPYMGAMDMLEHKKKYYSKNNLMDKHSAASKLQDDMFQIMNDWNKTHKAPTMETIAASIKPKVVPKVKVVVPKVTTIKSILSSAGKQVTPVFKAQLTEIMNIANAKGTNPYTAMMEELNMGMKHFENKGMFDKASIMEELKIDMEDLESAWVKPKVKVAGKTYSVKPIPTSSVPDAKDLTYLSDGSYLGGAGQKDIYIDKKGKQYIYKPAVNKDGSPAEFKAHIQESASYIQKTIDADSNVDVVVKTLNGKVGTVQPLLSVEKSNGLPTSSWTEFTKEQTVALQKEHVTDWLLGNFDSHKNNFILSDNKLLGIDKEQAFKYIDEIGSKKMDYDYHPNAKFGESEPVYNTLFKNYVNGNSKMQLQDTFKYIERIERIPDALYKENFRNYTEGLYGVGSKKSEELLNKILLKKKNLKSDYTEFFTQLETEKIDDGFIHEFIFKDTPEMKVKPLAVTSKGITYNSYEEIGMLNNRGINSDNANIKRDSEIFSTMNRSHKRAIETYSGGSYHQMNNYMRHGVGTDSDIIKFSDNIKKAIKGAAPLMKDTLLYRHTDKSALKNLFNDDIYELSRAAVRGNKSALKDLMNKVVGTEIKDKGILSTAYRKGVFVESEGIEIQIYAPKGFNNGIFIEEVSQHSSEAEFLINGGQGFEVLEVLVEDVQESSWSGSKTKNIIFKVVPTVE